MEGKPIVVRGRELPYPAVCAPLVARTADLLAGECALVAAKKPDMIEWRVDFFDDIADAGRVVEAARRIKDAAHGLPILFTRRSAREGGEKITITEPQVLEIYDAVCAAGLVDLIDYEMNSERAYLTSIAELARRHGVLLVLSFHDFQLTPPIAALVRRFERAQRRGADIVKIAVMPRSIADVLGLLSATSRGASLLSIPVAGMSMGPLGAVTRAVAGQFGSAMTFAVGASSSAPGQMPIEDVRSVIEVLRRATQ